MIDYRQLEALDSAAREGTFLKAAEKLRLTQPAISERVRLLEEAVGQPLLVRSTPVKLTEIGQKLMSHFQQVKILEHGLFDKTNPGEQDWLRLPIAVNFDSLASWFIPAITKEILSRKVRIEIQAANENMTLEYLRQGSVLACVSSEPKPLTGCNSEFLGSLIYRCVASPKLYRRMKMDPSKNSLETLLQLPAIIYGKDDRFHDTFLRQHYGVKSQNPPYLHVPFLSAMKEAALEGWGYALLLELDVLKELEHHQLIDLARGKRLEIKLYWHSVQLSNSILSDISKSLIGYARKTLDQKARR